MAKHAHGAKCEFYLSESAKSMHLAVQVAVEDFLTDAEISSESNRRDITSFHMLLGVFGSLDFACCFLCMKMPIPDTKMSLPALGTT